MPRHARGGILGVMTATRYFRENETFWKFEEGKKPQIKTPVSEGWTDSLFSSLEEFLEEGVAEEVTESWREEREGSED